MKPQKTPQITVLMPAYNAEKYIKEAIDSLLEQTFQYFEILIIDDGSTDKTLEIVKSYKDNRIQILNNDSNKGLIYSLNKGLKHIKSPYYSITDADDISEPERLQQQFEVMEQNKSIGFCGTWINLFGEHMETSISSASYTPTKHDGIVIHLFFCKSWGGHPLIRKSILDKHNLKYATDEVTSEDYDLYLKLSEVCKMANVPQVLYNYRQHPSSICAQNQDIRKTAYKTIVQREVKKLYPNINQYDLNLHTKIIFEEDIVGFEEVKNAIKHLEKLKEINLKNKTFEQNYFEQFLKGWALKICLSNTREGLRIFFLYRKSKLKIKIGLKNITHFFLDCLLKQKSSYLNAKP